MTQFQIISLNTEQHFELVLIMTLILCNFICQTVSNIETNSWKIQHSVASCRLYVNFNSSGAFRLLYSYIWQFASLQLEMSCRNHKNDIFKLRLVINKLLTAQEMWEILPTDWFRVMSMANIRNCLWGLI